MTRPLTEFEQGVLDRLEASLSRTRSGDDPWQRAWQKPRTVAESAAMGRLYGLGLIDRDYGRPSSKIGHRYRALSSLPEIPE